MSHKYLFIKAREKLKNKFYERPHHQSIQYENIRMHESSGFLGVTICKNYSHQSTTKNIMKNMQILCLSGMLGFRVFLTDGGYAEIITITARCVVMSAKYVKMIIN